MEAHDEVRIVLLGKTGSGKSSAGNVILGEEKFGGSFHPDGVTQDCQTEELEFNGRKITVTDTPGIFDPERSDEDLKKSIVSCLTECAPGVHAFILVLSVGKYTIDDAKSVNMMNMILKWFGEEALKHTVVLFTHGNKLHKNDHIRSYVDKNDDLSRLIKMCEGRVHVIDSKHWEKKDGKLGQGSERPSTAGRHPDESEYRSNSFQIKELLTTIDNMVRDNGGRYYENELLHIVEKATVSEINSKEYMEDRTEKANESDIRKRAKGRVRSKILKILAGVTAGAVLGALLGATAGVSIAVISAVGIGLGVAAGASAAAGAIGGGVVGAKAAARADTVGEAVKNAANDVVVITGEIAKEAFPFLAKGLSSKKKQ